MTELTLLRTTDCLCYVHPVTGKASTRARPEGCPTHMTRWDNCPGCRAGVKHLHCHSPWDDDGGG